MGTGSLLHAVHWRLGLLMARPPTRSSQGCPGSVISVSQKEKGARGNTERVVSLEETIIVPPSIQLARTLPHLIAKEAGKCSALVCLRGRGERGFCE